MRKRAEVVVVGAGIVGAGVAYHLTRTGIRNVVVVDQGPLEHTGGSSYHAPGLVFHANASRTLGQLAKGSTDLYRELHSPEQPMWLEVGGIELATTPERLAECHRRQASLAAIGIEARVLSPAEVVELAPLVDPGVILGGLHVARDGLCKGANVCHRLLRDAESRGAEINDLTEVVGFDIRDGRIRGVETTKGSIAASTVIACAGIWSKNLQALTGVAMPLQPMQHLMAYTVPVPELAGTTAEVEHPILRHQDRSMYFKQRGEAYGIGAYRHEPLTIEPRRVRPRAGWSYHCPARIHRGALRRRPRRDQCDDAGPARTSSWPTASTATSRSRPTATRCSVNPPECGGCGWRRESG